MNAESTNGDVEEKGPALPASLGDYGGGTHAIVDSMQTTRLIERALKQGWPIPEDCRAPVVQRQIEIATGPCRKPGEQTRAARTLVMMDRINKDVALRLLDKSLPDQHAITHGVDIKAIAAELEADPDYVQYLSQRACESDTDAGAVCQIDNNGHQRAVGNGSPHAHSEPGTNGSGNGRK